MKCIWCICLLLFTIFNDFRKNSQQLGEQYKKGIPIEVVPMAYTAIQKRIEDNYGGLVQVRMALAKAVNIFLNKFFFMSINMYYTNCIIHFFLGSSYNR